MTTKAQLIEENNYLTELLDQVQNLVEDDDLESDDKVDAIDDLLAEDEVEEAEA